MADVVQLAERRARRAAVAKSDVKPPLAERLAMLLAEVVDEPLAVLPGGNIGAGTEIHLHHYKPELAAAIDELLEETGY